MLRDLRDHSERLKWSREQGQNLSLHIFSHNYHNYSMFRDVPGCSGMFRDVPCSWFYRRPVMSALTQISSGRSFRNEHCVSVLSQGIKEKVSFYVFLVRSAFLAAFHRSQRCVSASILGMKKHIAMLCPLLVKLVK